LLTGFAAFGKIWPALPVGKWTVGGADGLYITWMWVLTAFEHTDKGVFALYDVKRDVYAFDIG
jgi:hypothetical protein